METTEESGWQGEFSLDDCKEELITPDLPDEQRIGRINSGVRLTHTPTGLSVQTYSSAEREENRKRAQRALKKRVESRYPPLV